MTTKDYKYPKQKDRERKILCPFKYNDMLINSNKKAELSFS